ncbi:unnamed protein product, partial [Effrenium voratum]
MAAATLDSEAAFLERAAQIGVETALLDALKAQGLATFGRLAFSTQYNPQLADEAPFRADQEKRLGGVIFTPDTIPANSLVDSFVEMYANTEIKLKSAWQRRSLAMDLANLASFQVIESWVQYLFLQLVKDQPRGFSKVTLQQLIECDKQMFIMASHKTMGKLQTTPPAPRPLDEAIRELQRAPDVWQYLAPIPAARAAPQS